MNLEDLPEVTCLYNLHWQYSALSSGDRAVPGLLCALTVSREMDCLDAGQNIRLAFYINNIILIKYDKQKETKYLRHCPTYPQGQGSDLTPDTALGNM